MTEYELQRSNLHYAQCLCVCECECVNADVSGGVEVCALLWHMHVQTCLITDQALRQRQTVL